MRVTPILFLYTKGLVFVWDESIWPAAKGNPCSFYFLVFSFLFFFLGGGGGAERRIFFCGKGGGMLREEYTNIFV